MGQICNAPSGQSILNTAIRHNIDIRAECGGLGVCKKCIIRAEPSSALLPPYDNEISKVGQKNIKAGWRLACKSIINSGPLRVFIPESLKGASSVIGKTGIHVEVKNFNPAVKCHIINPSIRGGEDLDIVNIIIKQVPALKSSSFSFSVLRKLSEIIPFKGELTITAHKDLGITNILPSKKTGSYGCAIDIGTTSLAVYLFCLETGKLISSASAVNPQRKVGEDVITRISYASSNANGTKSMSESVVQELNGLIAQCIKGSEKAKQDIDEITVVGNTTMTELFAGINPRALGTAPFCPVFKKPLNIPAFDIGLDISPDTNIHIFPPISGFLGGDTVAAILASGMHERDEHVLLVDIGTNGEIIIGNKDTMLGASCATGPAFEGAHIACGMRAVPGAISQVAVCPETFKISCKTIGSDEKPKGVCGSGLIDAVAELLNAGAIRSSGRLVEGHPLVNVDETGIGREVVLVPGSESAAGDNIVLTLADIRQVQLATAALRTGISILIKETGLEQIDKLILTGSLGASFDIKNVVRLGIIPDLKLFNSVESIVNAAGVGAALALLNYDARSVAARIAEHVRVVQLANHPDFMQLFTSAMTFPEASAVC